MDKYAYNAIWIVDAMYAIHMFKPMDTYREYFVAPLKWMLPERSANLICELGYSEQLSEEGLKNCKEFVRTVLHSGNLNETYLETRVRLYQNQPLTSTSTMTIPPDEDSGYLQGTYQAFIWNHCLSRNKSSMLWLEIKQ